MRRAAKLDANQHAIKAALEAIGCLVHSTAALGRGFPDLLVMPPLDCPRGPSLLLFEVKDGGKPPSARRLTPDEAAFAAKWPVTIVCSVDEAIKEVRR